MNENTAPLPRWMPWAAAAVIFAAYGALAGLDAHTEALIAQSDAEAAKAVAQIVQQYGIECAEPLPALAAKAQP